MPGWVMRGIGPSPADRVATRYVLTGFGLGPEIAIWLDQPAAGGDWSDQDAAGGSWTDQAQAGGTWTDV